MDTMNKPDGERIAALEQHMKDQDDKLKDIAEDVKTIKIIVQKQDGFDERLKRIESSSNLWKWLSPIFAAVLGSILTFLVISYLTKY